MLFNINNINDKLMHTLIYFIHCIYSIPYVLQTPINQNKMLLVLLVLTIIQTALLKTRSSPSLYLSFISWKQDQNFILLPISNTSKLWTNLLLERILGWYRMALHVVLDSNAKVCLRLSNMFLFKVLYPSLI